MREQLLRHHVVGLDGGVDVFAVDADRHPHQHVLRTLDNLAVDLQQVAALQGFEPEVLKNQIVSTMKIF